MSVCPNVNLDEWKALEAEVGKFEAYRDFVETNGEIRDPKVVATKIAMREGRVMYQMVAPGDNGQPLNQELLIKMLEDLKSKFGDGRYEYQLVNKPDENFKGYVKHPPKGTDELPVIIINVAKATLDTPLHEYGHIFLDMIRVGNMRLYFNLLKRFENEPEFKDALEIVQREYAGKPGYDDIRMKEETIVRLLGDKAVGLIEPKTGVYKLLEEVWNKVITLIRNVLYQGNKSSIDVLDISIESTLLDLAHILANKDLLVDYGKGAAAIKYDGQRLSQRLNSIKAQLAQLGSIPEEQLSYFYWRDFDYPDPNKGLIVMYDADNRKKIRKYIDSWDAIQDYISNKMFNDTHKIYEWVRNHPGDERAIIKDFKNNPEFKWWRWAMGSNDDIARRFTDDISLIANGRSPYTGSHSLNAIMNDTRDIVKNSTITQVLGLAATERNLVLRDIFKIKALFSGLVVKGEKPDVVIQRYRDELQAIETKISTLKNRKTQLGRQVVDFIYESIHPDTGVVTTESIKVQADLMSSGVVYVAFNSSRWGYGDAFDIRDLSDPNVQRTVVFSGKNRTEAVIANSIDDARMARRYYIQSIDNQSDRVILVDADGRTIERTLSTVSVISQQKNRVFKILGGVMEAINELHATNVITAIKFTPAQDSSLSRSQYKYLTVDEFRAEYSTDKQGDVINVNGVDYTVLDIDESMDKVALSPVPSRAKLYPLYARWIFGSYAVNSNENELIKIPPFYSTGFNLGMDLHQVAEVDSTELPFAEEDNSLSAMAAEANPIPEKLDTETVNRVRAIEFANKLSTQLGVDYQIITAEEALALTKDSQNPWNGEKAFFVGGVVYFVGDHISTNMVLHEFAHALIRALSKENPGAFESLYNQIENTPEGKQLIETVASLYPDLDKNSPLFKEEVIVRVLEKAGIEQYEMNKSQSAFAKAIDNILYAIKQFLRKIFGKTVAVSKLNANTTVNELAEMLIKGKQFSLDVEQISEQDVVAYMKDRTDYINSVQKIKNTEVQALVNRVYDISTKHIDMLLNTKKYDELAELLVDEFQRGELQELKSNLYAYQTMIANKAKEIKDQMEYEQKRSVAFVDSMFRLEKIMEKVLLHMEDMMNQPDKNNVDNLHKARYYADFINYWQEFMKEVNTAINDKKHAISSTSPFAELAGRIDRNITRINNIINDMYADGARDVLYEQLIPIHESIKLRHEAMIEKARKNNVPASKIDRLFRDYYGLNQAELERMKSLQARKETLGPNELKELNTLEQMSAKGIALTPEKIELMLKGKMGDANFFSSYLEGYLYNTDPIIGGLALYVKNHMNEVMAVVQSKMNTFSQDIQDDLDELGYKHWRIGKLGEDVGFEDTISTRDPKTRELIRKKVWTFLNPFRDYRYDYDLHNDAVEKAQVELAKTGTKEAEKKLTDAITARQKFLRDYFHQEYTPEFYERQALFEKDAVGRKALDLRNNLFERMRILTNLMENESDVMEASQEMDLLWREYRQLHSTSNLDGTKKKDEPLEIALRLKEYRTSSRKFYEERYRKGVFENAYFRYQQELIDKKYPVGSPMHDTLMQEWIRRNTRRVIKDTYYERRNQIMDRIQEILSKLPDTAKKQLDQSAVWEEILDLTAGFRDEDNQPIAVDLSEGSIEAVKKLQQKLEDMRKNYAQRSGLSSNEYTRLNELHTKRQTAGLDQSEKMEMAALYNKRNRFGLNRWESEELDLLYQELSELSTKEATDYYVDIVNDWLTKLDTDKLHTVTNARSITKLSADELLNPAIINDLLDQDANFAKWFRANHIEVEFYNKTSGVIEKKWQRLYVWNTIQPANKDFLETYDIKDAAGNIVVTVPGLPANKYYARVVKKEYRTERIIGKTVDNQYKWLPKTVEEGAIDSRYINKEYYDLQRENPKLFALLEKLKKHHLTNQEELSYNSKLYLDFPRFRKSNLEVLQTKGVKGVGDEKLNMLTLWAKRVRDFFKGAKDDATSGYNDKDEYNLVRADMFDNEITGVPIHGLFDIDFEDVSTDITTSMMRYMMSAERQKQLVKISPVARAIQSVVNDPENKVKDLDKINKFNAIHRGVITYITKKGKDVRATAVNNFIEREFEGQRMAGFTKDIPVINKFVNTLFKRASFAFFAFNIPSALKNSYGAKFNAMLEASAGRYVNHISLQQGNAWSYQTMSELSFGGQLYRKGSKSLRQQMVELFDPIQDRLEEKFGEGISRTVAKDIASLSWFSNTRKWVELQASLQIFGGMMHHQKVKMFEGTPQETEISYINAWEVVDGKIQLKEGVDPEWGITYDENGKMHIGKKFITFKNIIHSRMKALQGAYAKYDQPEAQRYLAFRMLSYLRRYFTTMLIERFGFSGPLWAPKRRMNVEAGDMQMGTYIEFLRFLKETILSLGQNLNYMTPEEKRASLKVLTEVGLLLLINAALLLLFGWDPDDEDRYAKIRAKTGAMPFMYLTAGDPDRDFNVKGFLEVHAMSLLMNIRAENEQFIPFPGFGLDDYSALLDIKSIAFGPTLKSYGQLADDLYNIATGSSKAEYVKTVGPYEWQQAGGSKFWAHFAGMLGMTGSSLDPVKAIKGFESRQALAR